MKKVLLKVGRSGDDPIEEKVILSANKPKIDLDMDVRDKLAELVGKGNTLGADDKAAIYGRLQALLGKEKAQKVMNHAYIFNSRPDVQKLSLEEKLKSFYNIGSNDADVQGLIDKSKSLGYGVLPGFRDSISYINQQLLGRVPASETVSVDPEINKKVMLKIRK